MLLSVIRVERSQNAVGTVRVEPISKTSVIETHLDAYAFGDRQRA
jgi:hypothetical protein